MLTDFRGKKGERRRKTSMWEKNIDQLPLLPAPTRDQTHNLGMCPEQESKLRPSGLWYKAPINQATPTREAFTF